MAHYIYPAVFIPDEDKGYTVVFPDLHGCITEGDTLEETLEMAAEAMALHLYGMEVDGDVIPAPSRMNDVVFPEEATPDSFVSLVSAYTEPIYDEVANRAVKKTLTIPNWLNVMAEQRNINFSKVLQTALRKELNVVEK
jgi:predicted RNase H-like HicB family nuclease